MTLKIAVFISDHGYGHAARIQAQLELILDFFSPSKCHFFLCSAKTSLLLKQALQKRTSLVERVAFETDFGFNYSHEGMNIDIEATLTQLPSWTDRQMLNIPKIQEWLKKNSINVVISDISPYGIQAAHEVGIPTIAISNFFWSDQYELHFAELHNSEKIWTDKHKQAIRNAIENMKKAYWMTDLVCRYPFAMQMGDLPKKQLIDLPLIARKSKVSKKEGQTIIVKNAINYKPEMDISNKFVVHLGYGFSIPVVPKIYEIISHAPKYYLFVMPESFAPYLHSLPNVCFIPRDEPNAYDWFVGCDYLITKPGYSTVAEALINTIPLGILEFPTHEANIVYNQLINNHWAFPIFLDQLTSSNGWETITNKIEKQHPAILPDKLIQQDISPILEYLQKIQ